MSGFCSSRRARVSSEFYGWTEAMLQAELTAMQAAYGRLLSGGNINSASYTQGDGSKSITNQQMSPELLQQRIRNILMALGLIDRRRAMSPGY